MHRPDFDEFRKTLNTLSTLFGKPPLDDLAVQAYWNALKDQTLEAVRRGAEYHARYGKFFPKPVELRPRDERKPQQPGQDDGTNWARGYWRTQIVMGMCAELVESWAQFERTLLAYQQYLAEPLRALLNECETSDRRDGRTDELHAKCRTECRAIARWFSEQRAHA